MRRQHTLFRLAFFTVMSLQLLSFRPSVSRANPQKKQTVRSKTIRLGAKTPDANHIVPRAAWIVESLSATVAAAGFIMITVGATTLGRRDQMVYAFRNPSNSFTPPPRPSAKEVKDLQDLGEPMLLAGLIAAGVGVAGILVGTIWIIAHKAPGKAPANTNLSFVPTAKPTQHTLTLLHTSL